VLAGGAWAVRTKFFATDNAVQVAANIPAPVEPAAMPAGTVTPVPAPVAPGGAPTANPMQAGPVAANPMQSVVPNQAQVEMPATIGPPPSVPDKLAPPSPTLASADDTAHPVREAIAERRVAREERRAGPARFAVDASGDPALTIPAQALIEERLAAAGLDVVDSPRGADVVVRVRAEVIGNQDINFYGQTAVLTTAYLTVKPYAGNRALGAGLRQKIDYTPLNAEAKVNQALAPGLDRVVSAAREQ
jgi:serine/threonine-protein kinase